MDNIVTEQGDATSLPITDASFCMVVTRLSAHHWPDVPAALGEVKRVLKPNGLLVVMRTPAERVAAIRSLCASTPQETRQHFQGQPDGSFTIASTLFKASHHHGDIY